MASKKIGLRPAEIKLGSTIDYKEWLADNGPEQGGPRATCPAYHPSQADVTPSAQYLHSSLVSVWTAPRPRLMCVGGGRAPV